MGFFRNFDNRDRYSDLDGKPLHGCIQFNVKDGNTPGNIYDADKVPLANPQLTDMLGRTKNQVFIDADCVAYMYKYIGQGSFGTIEEEGIDPSDETKWELQYTVENAALDERYVAGDSAMAINTMDDLRNIDPYEVPEVGGVRVITLYGYYECGDKEPVNYVWMDESEQPDDNGAVIAVNDMLTGRWVMVRPTEHCDSRHFGVFPQDSYNADVDHTTGITQLVDYCNRESLRPFFNGSQAYPYFKYSALAVNSKNPIDVSDGTVFVDSTSSMFYGEWNGNPYFRNAATTVNSKTVRHSWHVGGHTGTDTYIVDRRQNPVLLSNVNVVFEVSPLSGTQLVDCELESNEKITGNIVLQDMTIHTDWFADNYDWGNLLMVNCKILLDNCKDANTYVLLKNKAHEADYGDLGEQTLSNTTLLANCIAENAAFSNVTIVGDTELHNVSGTVNVTGAAYTLNFIDCWITIANTGNKVLSNVQWRRGMVSFDPSYHIQVLNSLYLDGVDVNATFFTPGIRPQYIGCSVNAVQKNYREVQYVDCRISADIVQYPELYTYEPIVGDAYYMAGEFVGNKFMDQSRICLSPISGADYSGSIIGVIGSYCNNFSDHNFVDDSAWAGIAFSTRHTSSMKYEGNVGGCPVGEIKVARPITYTNLMQPTSPSSFKTIPDQCRAGTGLWIVNDWRSGGNHEIATSMYWVLNLAAVPFDVSNLFRLKHIVNRASLDIHAEVQSFIRTDSDGFYVSQFNLHSPLLQTAVDGTAVTAYLSTVQPCRFEYVGDRLYTNNDIDEKRSALWYATYDYKNDASRFNANVHYTLSFYK